MLQIEMLSVGATTTTKGTGTFVVVGDGVRGTMGLSHDPTSMAGEQWLGN